MGNYAELEPEGVALAEALPILMKLCGLIFAARLIYMSDGFCRALFGTLTGATSWIPWFGSKVSGTLHSVEQRITNYLGSAEAKIDSQLGTSFHKLARIVDHVGRELF